MQTITPNAPYRKGKAGEREICGQKDKKTVDLIGPVCYIMYYLSEERSIFVRFFARENLKSHLYTGRQCPASAG